MCGRYTLRKPGVLSKMVYQAEFEEFSEIKINPLTPRFNISPGQFAPIVRLDKQDKPVASLVKWRLIPSWTKGKPKVQPFNARSDKVVTSGMYKQAMANAYGVDLQYVQIGADLLQIILLAKTARQERIAQASNCFVAGTKVLVGESNGNYVEKSIEEIAVGNTVLSRGQNNPMMPSKRSVTQLFSHTAYDLQEVTVGNW